MMKLPPFDADARCPKCGSEDLNTRYHARAWECCSRASAWGGWCRPRYHARAWECCWGCPVRDAAPSSDECPPHLLRTCRRCGYQWGEAPLDEEAVSEEIIAALDEEAGE